MKKSYILSIFLVLVALYSCETYDVAEPDFSNSYPSYVELLDTTALTVPEGGNILIVLTSRTVVYEGYSVSYQITGDISESGDLEVPAGVNRAQVAIPVESGIVQDEALHAVVTLTGVTGDIALGRKGENLSVQVNITKFVPFDADDYATTFDCYEPGYGVYSCTFEKTDNPNVMTNTNFWDYGLNIDYTFSADFEQLITIETQSVTTDEDVYVVEGSGTYDGVTQIMVVDYMVSDADGNIIDMNTHTFTLP